VPRPIGEADTQVADHVRRNTRRQLLSAVQAAQEHRRREDHGQSTGRVHPAHRLLSADGPEGGEFNQSGAGGWLEENAGQRRESAVLE